MLTACTGIFVFLVYLYPNDHQCSSTSLIVQNSCSICRQPWRFARPNKKASCCENCATIERWISGSRLVRIDPGWESLISWIQVMFSGGFHCQHLAASSSDPSSECFFGAFWFEARQFRRQGPRAASPWWDFTRDHDPEVVRNRWPWPTHRAAETHTPRKLKASSSTSDCESTNLKEEFGWTPLAFPPWHKALFCHFNLTLILFVYYSAVGHPWTFLFSIMFSIVREMVQICPNWNCCLATVSCIHFCW